MFSILDRFENQELHLTLHEDVSGKTLYVKGSITPPEFNLVAFLILIHTLKKEGAKKVIAYLPYLAYTRHDTDEPHKSRLTALMGALLAAAGADKVVTIDVHSPAAKKLFPIPLQSLSPAPLFKEVLKNVPHKTIVAPDKGARARAQAVAGKPTPWISKKRTESGVVHTVLHGTVKGTAVIVDDILDTGQTLVSCCQKLREQGVKEIIVMVTHGLFTGRKWQKLWALGVKRIYCTDTVPVHKKDKRIVVLPITWI